MRPETKRLGQWTSPLPCHVRSVASIRMVGSCVPILRELSSCRLSNKLRQPPSQRSSGLLYIYHTEDSLTHWNVISPSFPPLPFPIDVHSDRENWLQYSNGSDHRLLIWMFCFFLASTRSTTAELSDELFRLRAGSRKLMGLLGIVFLVDLSRASLFFPCLS